MSESENKLLSLLFHEGRELNNLKFFPGPDCGSSDQMYDAACEAINTAMKIDDGNMIPVGRADPTSIADFVSRL